MFKKLLLVGLLIMLVLASCARMAIRVGSDVIRTSEELIVEEIDFSEEVFVTKRINNEVVFNQQVALEDLDELDFKDMDIDVSNVSFDFNDDGIFFSLRGADSGEDVVISAEITDDMPRLSIETSGEDFGR